MKVGFPETEEKPDDLCGSLYTEKVSDQSEPSEDLLQSYFIRCEGLHGSSGWNLFGGDDENQSNCS